MYIPRHVVTICSWRHKFYSPSITHYHFPFLTKKSLIYYKYNLSLLINFLISIRNKVNHTYIPGTNWYVLMSHHKNLRGWSCYKYLQYLSPSRWNQALCVTSDTHRIKYPKPTGEHTARNVGTIRDLSSHISVCMRL